MVNEFALSNFDWLSGRCYRETHRDLLDLSAQQLFQFVYSILWDQADTPERQEDLRELLEPEPASPDQLKAEEALARIRQLGGVVRDG